jgi:hypothetical protein
MSMNGRSDAQQPPGPRLSRDFPGSRIPGDWSHPCWDGYRGMLRRLDLASFPTPAQLSGLLTHGTVSGGGAPLRFVPAGTLPGSEYERRIFETGEVSTRENNWHDLFNALAWCRLPRLKAALNAVHYRHLDQERDGRRGPRRDALTLLDESGALLVSRNRGLLHALARRDWRTAFVDLRRSWRSETRIVVCGHALLEKYLEPWKSITAHTLLLNIDAPPVSIEGPDFTGRLDALLGERLREPGLCDRPGDLSPVPLAGIPGWWRAGAQDAAFYGDGSVFRAPPVAFVPAPVHRLESIGPAPAACG